MKYYYIIIEFGKTGYVLAKAKNNVYYKKMDRLYKETINFFDEQMKMGNPNEEIIINTGLFNILCSILLIFFTS